MKRKKKYFKKEPRFSSALLIDIYPKLILEFAVYWASPPPPVSAGAAGAAGAAGSAGADGAAGAAGSDGAAGADGVEGVATSEGGALSAGAAGALSPPVFSAGAVFSLLWVGVLCVLLFEELLDEEVVLFVLVVVFFFEAVPLFELLLESYVPV